MIQDISFKNSKGHTLLGVLYVPEKKYKRKYPVVILCHGRGGCKDAKKMVSLAEALFEEGFAVLRFDFSGHGKSDGDYSETTLTQELDDLRCAIGAIYSLDKIDRKKLGIIGHSFGGSVVIVEAATDSRVKSAVSIAGVADMMAPLRLYTGPKALKRWSKDGFIDDGSKKLKYSFITDFKKYNILDYAKRIKIPFLVIHGIKDNTVGLHQAKEIARMAKAPLKIVNEDHDFGKESITAAVDWFKKTLR
ncbi:MAG: alpha/beta fold hydrolase [Candidatus Woesearchaeota archaeon]